MVWLARRGASCRAGPLACPVLGTVGVAEAPGSRAAAGRGAAIVERPLGLEGRPGNLRRANHTITDVTGRGKAGPGVIGGGLPPPRRRAAADGWGSGRIVRSPSVPGWSGGREPFAVQAFRPGRARVRPPRVSIAMAISASGEW